MIAFRNSLSILARYIVNKYNAYCIRKTRAIIFHPDETTLVFFAQVEEGLFPLYVLYLANEPDTHPGFGNVQGNQVNLSQIMLDCPVMKPALCFFYHVTEDVASTQQ